MSETFDLGKRARELLEEARKEHMREREVVPGDDFAQQTGAIGRACKRLAREAADARAEEIAKRCERLVEQPFDFGTVPTEAARIARSTISKPDVGGSGWPHLHVPDTEQLDCETLSFTSDLQVAPDGTLSGTLPCGHSPNDICSDTQESYCPTCANASSRTCSRALGFV